MCVNGFNISDWKTIEYNSIFTAIKSVLLKVFNKFVKHQHWRIDCESWKRLTKCVWSPCVTFTYCIFHYNRKWTLSSGLLVIESALHIRTVGGRGW